MQLFDVWISKKMVFTQKIRIPVGFGYALLYLYFSQPTIESLIISIYLIVPGELLRIWASGHIVKGKKLSVCGPYKWTRNPLYLGSFFIGLGFSLASGKIWLILLFLTLFFCIYIPVMQEEKKELTSSFGDQYLLYSNRVSLFFPVPRRQKYQINSINSEIPQKFQWQKLLSNREHHTLIGIILVATLAAIKLLWE
jgi:protein-S-isoprenylcysteine O-methyltransferase Ste14